MKPEMAVFSRNKRARLERLELPTRCLEGSCSIHLSYRRVIGGRNAYRGERIRTADLLLPRQAR